MKRKHILFLLFYVHLQAAFSLVGADSIELQLKDLKGERRLDLLLEAARSAHSSNPGKIISFAVRALNTSEELKMKDKSAEACYLISEAYLQANNPDSSIFFAQRSIELYKLAGNTLGMIRALNNTGLANLQKSNTEFAEKIFIKAFTDCNLYLKQNPFSQQGRDLEGEVFNNLILTYVKMGNYLKAKMKLLQFSKKTDYGNTFSGMIIQRSLAGIYQSLGEYDSSLIYYNDALNIAGSLKDPVNMGRIYSDIGTTYYYMGKESQALDFFEKARDILLTADDKRQLAKVFNNMASTYIQISYYEKATQFLLESARLKEVLSDSEGLAATYNNLGLVYFDWDNNKMARTFLDKAISINQKRNNRKYLATNYTAKGDLYMDQKQADSALYYYRKSLELKTEMGNKHGIVISLHCLGDVYTDLLMNEAKGMEYYRQALALADSIGSESEIASLNTDLGELMYKKGSLAAAEVFFMKALTYASQENSLELIQKCSRYLTEISMQTGNIPAAREYFSLYRNTGDSLFSTEKTKAVLEMQTRFETEKKEQENLLLQKTNEFQKSTIRFLIGIAILLLLLGSFILILYRQKSRALKQIVEKNLEIVKTEQRMEDRKSMLGKHDHSIVLPPDEEIENTTLGLLVKFKRLMENEKPYLEAGLTVDDVCKKISTNRSYLSQMIHENFNQNFNGFINELRIKEARRLLADPKYNHLSIEGIGSMSGFSTKVTFHSIFKKQIGVTPSYFRNSIAESRDPHND